MSELTERVVWLITSVLGIAVAAIYMTFVWSQIQLARQSRFSLQLPQLWGQFAGGGMLAARFLLMMLLGVWALAESPLAAEWAVRILILGNVLVVLDVVALIVALNWTVGENDEEAAAVAEGLAGGERRIVLDGISEENPLPVKVVDSSESAK